MRIRKLLIGPILVLVAVVAFVAVRPKPFVDTDREFYPDPAERTEYFERRLATAIQRLWTQGLAATAAIRLDSSALRRYGTDAWGRRIAVAVRGDTIELRSPGADGVRDSPDDVVMAFARTSKID